MVDALKAQAIFNNFKDELGGFTSAIELSESQIDLIEGIGACYYHIRKDEQITVRKLAILPEHQNQGWGRLLVYRVICKAIEEKKSSVFLKCPSNSIANQFYQKLGFELEATEQGKNQPINHWRYHIKLPLLFYCGGGGKSRYDAIANDTGWNSGINSGGKNKAHHHMMMVDNSWKNYNHTQHLEMVRQNKPLVATARDIEHPEQLPEILEQAAELAQYVGRVLLIPKCDVTLPENYWLAYSVESKYGKTDLKPEWFGNRPVHLLGGSPKKQALLYPQMNVVSLDANYAMNLARNCKAVWSDGEKNIEQREQDCYLALGLSLSKQFEFWQNSSLPISETKPANKESDKWYTPPKIQDLVTQVLGTIDLDPCADDGKHIKAAQHFTAADDGLSRQWHLRVFMNPPYSCSGKWVAKLQAEIDAGRVSEAIALVPAATDTNWLSPLLDTQPICFWKGRIKFLDTSYQPKQSARQSHCLVYWGNNSQKFKEVFNEVGVVKNADSWNPADFGSVDYKADGDQLTIFCEDNEPPEPDDYPTVAGYEQAWTNYQNNQPKDKTMTAFQFSGTQATLDQIAQVQEQLNQLTSSLKPYQECEQKAEELRLRVAEYADEMATKGISQDDILVWGNALLDAVVHGGNPQDHTASLYSAASGTEFVDTGSSVIAAQNQVIAELKTELTTAQKRCDHALAERQNAVVLLENATAQKDEALADVVRTIAHLKLLESENMELKAISAQTDTATIEVLQKENASLIVKIQELEAMTDDMDAQLAEQQLMPEVEAQNQVIAELKNEVARANALKNEAFMQLADGKRKHDSENIEARFTVGDRGRVFQITENYICGIDEAKFSKGDRVAVVDVGEDEDLRYLLGNSGIVISVKDDSVTVLMEINYGIDEHEVVLRSRYLNYMEPIPAPHPDIEAQIKGREFIASIKTKAGANNITWQSVSDVCQSNPVVLVNMCLSASTKLQKEFVSIDNLARLMADYVSETGDITDFGWLDEIFVFKVEALMEAKKSLAYHKNDWVRSLETGVIWQVRSFDGEWLSAILNNKITSLHKSEVELVEMEVAA